MLSLELYVGKKVNIVCNDGDAYNNCYVDCFTDVYDNGAMGGRILYRSEIKSIEIID